MVVFVTGANGFIGSAIVDGLRGVGHRVIEGRRQRGGAAIEDSIGIDFTRDIDPETWRPRLTGVDAVINTVGIIRERGLQTFDTLHFRAPRALFAACAEVGVSRVIQLSALGADKQATSAYHQSKLRADDFLSALPLSSAIVQPSLVYGAGGESARLFNTLASLPLIPLPGSGMQRIQPIHIDDLVTCVVALLDRERWCTGRISLVGPEPVTLREYLAQLRQAFGAPRPRFINVPRAWVQAAATLGEAIPGALLDKETLAMLERGSIADVDDTKRLLGTMPRHPTQFVARSMAPAVRQQAYLNWLLPLLRLAIATMWIVTGIVSLAVYPLADSFALLARTGITGTFATVALITAAVLDLVLGVATLVAPGRALWWSQIVLIIGYTAIISWWLPEFWAHPYGPVLKNLPISAALLLLVYLRDR